MPAPISRVPPGYQPILDGRLPTKSGGSCRKMLLWMLVLTGFICGGLFALVSHFANAGSPAAVVPTIAPTTTDRPTDAPHATDTPRPTLDGWSLTGTAIIEATASATFTLTSTVDYCAFLTPTATATATLIYTPDSWQATGTAIYFETNTPTDTPPLLPTSPRAWCDYKLPTATITATAPATSTAQPTTPPTLTSAPKLPPYNPPDLPPTVEPAPVFPTEPAPVIPVPVTPVPATRTPKPTKTPTTTPTSTPTVTPTDTPTSTPTSTPTDTPTSTPTDTPTNQPTAAPMLVITSASCAAGYPLFEVQNQRAAPGDYVVWQIVNADGLTTASGYWLFELSPGALVIAAAPAWANVPGIYTLTVYQPWDALMPAQSAAVVCASPPTLEPSPTDTAQPESTDEVEPPTPTPTIEASE